LLEPALGFGVDVAFTAEEGKKHGEENESVCRRPEDESNPDAEVVYFEDLVSVELAMCVC
jgi:hypothetical protein